MRELIPGERVFFTLDDLDVRAQAGRSPRDLLSRAESMILGEVQRVPDLLLSVKQAVDEDRRPGRFLLTGSANLLMMQAVSESLAGRAAYLTLRPLTRREFHGEPRAGLWPELIDNAVRIWPDVVRQGAGIREEWSEVCMRGGYPVPVLELESAEERAIWFEAYVRTYLERDLQDLSSIDNLVDFRRLMGAAVERLGQLVNQTELGRDVQLPQPTVRRWLNLLETSHQLVRLPAYAVNRTKRLIKTPKLYWTDTGLALHLAGSPVPRGADLENLVLADLLAWRDAATAHRPELFYWRAATGEEVDFVVETPRGLLALEVKATRSPRPADVDHLRVFRREYGDRVIGCLLLHGGDDVSWLAEGVLAVPWWRIV